jgi:hypothetical protein
MNSGEKDSKSINILEKSVRIFLSAKAIHVRDSGYKMMGSECQMLRMIKVKMPDIDIKLNDVLCVST